MIPRLVPDPFDDPAFASFSRRHVVRVDLVVRGVPCCAWFEFDCDEGELRRRVEEAFPGAPFVHAPGLDKGGGGDAGPAYQAGAHPECERPERRALFEVGARLRFVGYVSSEEGGAFVAGDLLEVLPVNGCGIGIDVRRLSDGLADMVFPEEAELVPSGP